MDERKLNLELMDKVNQIVSEKVDDYLKENNIKDLNNENKDRLANFLNEGIKNELETNFSIEDKLELLNDKDLLKESVEKGVNSLIEIENRDFNEAWGFISNAISKEELIFNGFDEKIVDTAIKLETFSRDNEFVLSNQEIDNMNYSKAIEIVTNTEKEIENRDNLFAAITSENKETLDKLSDSDCKFVLNAVAENEYTSKETFEKLLDKNDDTINWHIATNQKTPEDILEQLSDSDKRSIKMEVANNSNASAETLDKLSDDSEFIVKLNVARNPNASAETLEKLSSDDSVEVRNSVIDHPNASERARDIAEKINEISSEREVSSSIKTEDTNTGKASQSMRM